MSTLRLYRLLCPGIVFALVQHVASLSLQWPLAQLFPGDRVDGKARGLYYKTLQICNVQENNKVCSKLEYSSLDKQFLGNRVDGKGQRSVL